MRRVSNVDNCNVVLFGELLFDCFPTGKKILGGAPLNVAWNLHQLGLPAFLVSATGNDELGKEAINKIKAIGLSGNLLQTNRYPTGTVDVVLSENHEPVYNILDRQAYDFIDSEKFQKDIVGDETAILYHGTLALRHKHNRDALNKLGQSRPASKFVDINIRMQYYDRSITLDSLASATWGKLNCNELELLTGGQINPTRRTEIELAAKRLFEELASTRVVYLRNLVVTCGQAGAYWIELASDQSFESVYFESAESVENLVDTVGAGDAFAAICIRGILQRQSPKEILREANQFAAAVCQIHGGTTADNEFYKHFVANGDNAIRTE